MTPSIEAVTPPLEITGAARTPRAQARTSQEPAAEPSAAPVDSTRFAAVDDRDLRSGERSLEFSFDDTLNRVVVKIRSAESGEVLRQIPPEVYLKFMTRFREQIGVLFDETA